MHRPTISEIEAGRRNIKSDELTQFSEIFGVELNWLANGDSESSIDPKILIAARELSTMKNEDVEKLIKTIRMISK